MIIVWLDCELDRQTQRRVLGGGARSAISAALKAKGAGGYRGAVGLMMGPVGIADAAQQASACGLDEILYVESPLLENYSTLVFESVFRRVLTMEPAECVIGVSDSRGKDLLPRIAVFLDSGICTEIVEFLPGRRYRRPMYAGNITATVLIDCDKRVLTVRSSAFEHAAPSESSCPVRKLDVPVEASTAQTFVSAETAGGERPALNEAKVVVSGGRALKSKEAFLEVLGPLADELNAGLGASRAAVDAGFAPNDWQVGQTGKIVAPDLYIAVGISGAIQHLAGMKDAKVIVAVNQDAEAPIFEAADYGLVGDLFDIVPQLVEELKRRPG